MTRGISTRIPVIVALIITVVLIDTLAFRITIFYREQYLPTILFIIVSVVLCLGQLFILFFIRDKSRAHTIGRPISLIRRLAPMVQYSLVAIVATVILQLILLTYYSTVLLISAVAISYTASLVMIGLLTQKFVSWFKSNRRWIVLLYGISFAILLLDIVVALSLTINLLADGPKQVWPHYGIVYPHLARASLAQILEQAYVIFSIMSFAAMWFATALLLYSYSLRLGRLRYWLLISSPLVFFLSQFVTVFVNVFTPFIESDPFFFSFFFTMIFSLTKPAGGILFGVAFWSITRNMPNKPIIRESILISAWGFVLLFISSQANALFTNPYPPFGLATVTFLSLSSYLLLMGIYSSAVMISEDSKLRTDIRNSVLNDSRLLESISRAELEQEIQNRVAAIMSKHRTDIIVEEKAAAESFFDAKLYLNEVMDEFLTKRDKIKKEGEEPT